MSSSPESSTGATRIRAPVRSQSCCQGTILEWCSISVSTISESATMRASMQRATRLIDSVAPRVNTISFEEAALSHSRVRSRAPSNAAVAMSERACTPRCTFACISTS